MFNLFLQKVVASVPKESIRGIGFAATCSLVVLDKVESPVTVSPTGNFFILYRYKKIKKLSYI